MRQVIQTYNVAKFSELSEVKQDKVLEKLNNINVDDDFWSESIVEYYTEKLKKLGFYDIKFKWSGFWSQGDGASFSAKHRRGNVSTIGRYCHSGSMRSDNEVILEVARRIADKFYSQLQKEYEYLTSREAVIETIEANEYEFNIETLKIE